MSGNRPIERNEYGMSSKTIKFCDICKNQIDTIEELYEPMEDNIFGINQEWDLCENCMDSIKLAVKEIIGHLKEESV